MSSPDLNCFLAAALTASFIASITRSRSMPCSWQSASMFCAIDELMNLYYLRLARRCLPCAPLSLFNCYSVVGLRFVRSLRSRPISNFRSQISDFRSSLFPALVETPGQRPTPDSPWRWHREQLSRDRWSDLQKALHHRLFPEVCHGNYAGHQLAGGFASAPGCPRNARNLRACKALFQVRAKILPG